MIGFLLAFTLRPCLLNAASLREEPLYYPENDNQQLIQTLQAQPRTSQSQPFVPYTPEQFKQGFGLVSSDDTTYSPEEENPLSKMWSIIKDYVSGTPGLETARAEERKGGGGIDVELPDPVGYTYSDPAGYSMQSGFEGYIVPSMPHLGEKGAITGLIIAVAVLSGILAVLIPMSLGWLTMFKRINIVRNILNWLRTRLFGRSGREFRIDSRTDEYLENLASEVWKSILKLSEQS
ncbi:hypothetical protein QYM36_018363 [Artemia franciscana]|uniref:Uncharacterized protein n=1 Tax=Artemia franciscana TaxID=6661 RepID=A0AA88H9M2_ARTSF|nr:hypothetical protein QYM36_018363 [Artemia franciscana]